MAETVPTINLGALAQRVTGVEQGLSQLRNEQSSNFLALGGQVSALGDKFVARSQTPWSTLISAAGFIVLIGGLYSTLSLRPLEQAISQNAKDITQLKEDLVPRGEHTEKWRANDNRFDDQSRQLVAVQNLLTEQIKGESASIDDLKHQFGATYGLRDILADIQKRMDRLEEVKKNGS